jgi:hypothetical protein
MPIGLTSVSTLAQQSYSVSVLLLPEAVRIPEAATLLSFSQLSSVETALILAVASLLSVSLLSPETAGASAAAAKAAPHILMIFWQRWEATTAD